MPAWSTTQGSSWAVRVDSHRAGRGGPDGGRERQEQLALGEAPNLAARLQGLAAPNTLVISAATLQLLGGFFTYQSFRRIAAARPGATRRGLSGPV